MTRLRLFQAACIAHIIAATFAVRAVRAEPTAEDRVLATALFKQARKLLDEGDVARACRKFEESERLDPSGGTLLNLAACHEREGRTASAWTEFEAALAIARRDGRADRARVAADRIAALEKRLPYVTIVVADAEAKDVEITIDGSPVRHPAWGVAFPVDPGDHVVEARAVGMQSWRTTLSVTEGSESLRVDVPRLDPLPRTTEPGATMPTERAPEREGGVRPRDAAMVGGASVGVAGLALGTYFGLHAIAQSSDAASGCPSGHCTRDAAALSERAATNADIATVSFVVSGVALGGALALLLTRPRSLQRVNAAIGAGGVSIRYGSRF